MPLVAGFLQSYPEITADVLFSDSNADLIEEELDVAVRIGLLAGSALVARRVGEVGRFGWPPLATSPGGEPRSRQVTWPITTRFSLPLGQFRPNGVLQKGNANGSSGWRRG